MSRQYNDPASWQQRDEFQWEQELRKEDFRISCYFRELPLCMDLPGEEEMILEGMLASPGLVSANAAPGQWRLWDEAGLAGRLEQASELENPPRRREGDEWIERLDLLLAGWNAVAARELDGRLIQEGLAVSCGFGKTIVRVSDFLDMTSPELLSLKICLGKRAVDDINSLCWMLEIIAEAQPSLAAHTGPMADTLQLIREYLTDQLAELRRM